MKKNKVKVEEYTQRVARRSWLACQENRNDASIFDYDTIIKYRIICGDKILDDGYSSIDTAEMIMKARWTEKGIKERKAIARLDFFKSVIAMKKELNQTLKNLDKQLKKLKKL